MKTFFLWLCCLYLFCYDAILLEVLGSKLIITGQAVHFDLWVLGFDKLSTKAQQNSCHTLSPVLRSDTQTFHEHSFPVVNYAHRLQSNLQKIIEQYKISFL